MIRAAIFDVDGTLLDSMPIWEDARRDLFKKTRRGSGTGAWQKALRDEHEEGAGLSAAKIRIAAFAGEIISGVSEVISGFYFREAPLKPHAESFLKALRAKGIPMAVATSNERRPVEAAFRRLGIAGYFTEIFTCSEVGAGKTEPDIFIRAAAALRTPPQETWVFEDAFYAAYTARQAGFRVAGLYDKSGADDLERLKETADLYIGDFHDFTGFYRIAGKEETP